MKIQRFTMAFRGLLLGLGIIAGPSAMAQNNASTYSKVYNTFQTSCAFSSCHSHGKAVGGLDLEGAGTTDAAKMKDVFAGLFDKNPANAYSASKGHKLVFPGDPYRSTIFRKAHGGIANEDITLDPREGAAMPQGGIGLEPEEAERIRQWILYGAPETGSVANDSIIQLYYSGKGIRAIAQKPQAPAADKGFQIHLGPFLLPPTSARNRAEIEYFAKYATQLPESLEVTRIEPHIGNGYSHHFILYKFNPGKETSKPYGLRFSNSHLTATVVSAHQDGQPLQLPPNTAFHLEKNAYLDLNTHYINYSTTKALACDVYLNVYTQPMGTAKQQMYTTMIPNPALYVPADGKEYTLSQDVFSPDMDTTFYIWAMGSHTHQYGKGYQIFLRNADGTLGEQVYDGVCDEGKPGCMSGEYDYQHPPVRYFNEFMPVKTKEGFIQKATYRNTGTTPVRWGEKSTDEMMVMALMYTLDTAGIFPPKEVPKDTMDVPQDTTVRDTTVTSIGDNLDAGRRIRMEAGPNPARTYVGFRFHDALPAGSQLRVYDLRGREVHTVTDLRGGLQNDGLYRMDRRGLPSGLYMYQISGPGLQPMNGKVVFE